MAFVKLSGIFLTLGILQIALALTIPPRTDKSSIQYPRRSYPIAASNQTYLNLEFHSSKQSYYANEATASVVVNALINYEERGAPFSNKTFIPGSNDVVPFKTLRIRITNSLDGMALVPWSEVAVNSVGTEFTFNLTSLVPKVSPYPVPYPVNIMGVSPDGIQSFYGTSAIMVLPGSSGTIGAGR